MRYSIFGTILTGSGTAVDSASVTVFDFNPNSAISPSSPARIYEAFSGGSYVQSSFVLSNSLGFWQCWFDDADYLFMSHWTIVVSKAGFVTQSYRGIR